MSIEQEKEGLTKVLDHLKEKGWFPTRLWDGEVSIKVTGWESAKIAEECAQTDEAALYLDNLSQPGISNHLYLVWGNSPVELIADHSLKGTFEADVTAAHKAVFPEYDHE